MIAFLRVTASLTLQLLALTHLGSAAIGFLFAAYPELSGQESLNRGLLAAISAGTTIVGLIFGWLGIWLLTMKKKRPQPVTPPSWEPPSVEELTEARDKINDRFDRLMSPSAMRPASNSTSRANMAAGKRCGSRSPRGSSAR